MMDDRTSPETEILQRVFDRISTRLNDVLCEMKPDYDDSIVGFNEAWDIMRAVFKDELTKPRVAPSPGLGESQSDLREENLRSLLREARQYVHDDFLNDDMEVNKHSQSLLKDIDAALGSPDTSTVCPTCKRTDNAFCSDGFHVDLPESSPVQTKVKP